MSHKEDCIRLVDPERQTRAQALLANLKRKREGKEFVRVPLETGRGYREIERGKYERMKAWR